MSIFSNYQKWRRKHQTFVDPGMGAGLVREGNKPTILVVFGLYCTNQPPGGKSATGLEFLVEIARD